MVERLRIGHCRSMISQRSERVGARLRPACYWQLSKSLQLAAAARKQETRTNGARSWWSHQGLGRSGSIAGNRLDLPAAVGLPELSRHYDIHREAYPFNRSAGDLLNRRASLTLRSPDLSTKNPLTAALTTGVCQDLPENLPAAWKSRSGSLNPSVHPLALRSGPVRSLAITQIVPPEVARSIQYA